MRRALAGLWLLAACGGTGGVPDAGAPPDAGLVPDAGEPEIVRAHNAVRARAMPVPQPALEPMTWHEGAAATAAAWVEQCEFRHNLAIQGTYGENIYAAYGSEPTPTAVVEDWASEVADYDLATNTCAVECGHYTQLVWRASTGVGCAHKVCDTGSPFGPNAVPWVFWVCDYAPPGNFVGERPY